MSLRSIQHRPANFLQSFSRGVELHAEFDHHDPIRWAEKSATENLPYADTVFRIECLHDVLWNTGGCGINDHPDNCERQPALFRKPRLRGAFHIGRRRLRPLG